MYLYNLALSFESTAGRHAERPALCHPNGDIVTYRALNAVANQAARQLLELGVETGSVVAISGVKTTHVFAALLACLKLGAAYTVFDPASPAERLGKSLETCQPAVVLACRESLAAVGESASAHTVVMRSDSEDWGNRLAGHAQDNLKSSREVTGEDVAYIMFTSGSTGVPKGAVMTHANVLNLIGWSVSHYGFDLTDRLTNVNPLYFDNSVFDFYSSLFSGASLVPIDRETVTDARRLIDLIDSLQCTSWFSVPTLLMFLQTMKVLTRERMTHLRRIIFGGEGYPRAKLRNLYDLYGDRAELHNVYGPTECTCICSSYLLSDADFSELEGFPPLGDLIPNFRGEILSGEGQRVPDGEVGELCLMGPSVGKGYYGDESRTMEVFRRSSLSARVPQTMYHTGDLVRRDPQDRKIHICGRRDNQVKHMGYRIELEEIETALCRLPGVEQAAVVHTSLRGLSRLIGIVAASGTMEESAIRARLGELLPAYMLPTTIRVVGQLPRNANGKVDRRLLLETYGSEG